ncbi:hypothetical protein NIES2119_10055 [[Phormidium ambiguum] IAM M-71]|uniref:Uncharacterized protein n=1 Tax=[Phormidium ambiguum] IAM M-71 TaxID=454136 RepID=A0A1U7IMC0_9CYAN|nr:hypothetical protein NIES2119_10055 [Phormidium ambiguum IAM M-71]
MGGTLTVRLRVKGESRPQTGNPGSESCSGKHNPKVSGSNPLPATKLKSKTPKTFVLGVLLYANRRWF